MSKYEESVNNAWAKTKEILLTMSELYIKIKKDPSDQNLQKKFALRIIILDKHSQNFFNELRPLHELDQYGQLYDIFHNDLNGELYDDMGSGKFLCRDIVERIISIVNFHVLHLDGDQELWKSLKRKYDGFLKIMPNE